MKISKFYKLGFWFISFWRGGYWSLSVHHCLKSTKVKLPHSAIKWAASFTPAHTYWLHLPKAEVRVGLPKSRKGCEKLWKRPFHSFVSLEDSGRSAMSEWDAEGEGHQTVPRTPALWARGVVAEMHLVPNSPLTAVLPQEAPQNPTSAHTAATRPEIPLSLRAPETRVTGRSGHGDPSGNGKETKRNRADLSKREEMTTFCTSLVQGDEREMETENSVEILWPHWVQSVLGTIRIVKKNKFYQELILEEHNVPSFNPKYKGWQ